MIVSTALDRLRSRLIDLLGAGAAFRGVSGAAVALVSADGRILKMSDPASQIGRAHV